MVSPLLQESPKGWPMNRGRKGSRENASKILLLRRPCPPSILEPFNREKKKTLVGSIMNHTVQHNIRWGTFEVDDDELSKRNVINCTPISKG